MVLEEGPRRPDVVVACQGASSANEILSSMMEVHAGEHLGGLQHSCSSYCVGGDVICPSSVLSRRGCSHLLLCCGQPHGLLQSMNDCLKAVTPCHCDVGQQCQGVALSAGQAQRLRLSRGARPFELDRLMQGAVQTVSPVTPSRL